MPPKKSKKKPAMPGNELGNQKENPHLPGMLLIAYGLLALPLNLDLIPGLEWAKAWPLVLALFGVVLVVKEMLSPSK